MVEPPRPAASAPLVMPLVQRSAPQAAAAAAVPKAVRPARRRVALVGAGYVARFHAEVLAELPGVEIAAVVDRDPARAEALARSCGAAVATALEDLPTLGIEVAHVLVPPDAHAEVTRRLVDLGIGAFVEKPLAETSDEARALHRLAAARELSLGVNHNAAAQPAFRRLLAGLLAGRIGRLEHVQATLAATLPQLVAGDHSHWMFRRPDHVLLEQAVHPCSLLHTLLGRVERATTLVGGSRTLSTGVLFYGRWDVAARAARGTASLHLDFGSELPRFTLTVLGSDGAAEVDLLAGTLVWQGTTPWIDAWDRYLAGRRRAAQLRSEGWRSLLAWNRHTLGLGRRDDPFYAGMRDSIAGFHARLGGGERPAEGGAAAEVLEWCEAIWAGRTVRAEGALRAVAPTPVRDPGPRPGEIVLLGGSGVIGRALAARLLHEGRPVTVTSRRGAMPAGLVAAGREAPRAHAAALDDPESLRRALAGARTVVHLATGGGETWEEIERRMVRGSIAAAAAALAEGVERFVYVSSLAALDLCSAAGGEVSDDHPLDPLPRQRDLYSRGKVESERALARMHREQGLPLVVVRPGIVLGGGAPLQHPGLGYWVRDTHCIGWGRGRHPLPVVTAADVADALALIVSLREDDLHGQALNLSSRAPLSAAALVAAFGSATGRALRFHPRLLAASQGAEVGKWLVKRLGGRRSPFPPYRDLAARELRVVVRSETARERLGWRPVEEPVAFLRAVLDGEESSRG